MVRIRCGALALSLAAITLAAVQSALAADPIGPPIGSKNRYVTSIGGGSGADTDDYVGRLVEGEQLSVTVTAARRSDLHPRLRLVRPDGSLVVPVVRAKRAGQAIVLKNFPIDASGAWAVRLDGVPGPIGGAATTGEYTVSFKIKGTKYTTLKNLTLDEGTGLSRQHALPAIEGALLDLKVVFDKRRSAVTLSSLHDPAGDDVQADAVPLAQTAVTKKNVITLTAAALSLGDGDYQATLSTIGPQARYTLKYRVVPQDRLKSNKPVPLSAIEPIVSFGSGAKRVAAGTIVHLTGQGFASDLTVLVDGAPANVRSVGTNGTTIDFDAPEGDIGTTADLAIVNGDGQGFAVEDALFYAPPPEISALTDVAGNARQGGSTAGATGGAGSVRIVGTGLAAETAIEFGTTRASSPQLISATLIEVALPQHSPGTFTVSAVDEFGRRSTTPVQFEFKTPPSFSAAPYSPSFAPEQAELEVTVSGLGFESDDELLFDGHVIASNYLGTTTRSFTLPAIAARDYPVALRDRVGSVVQGPSYTVKAPPQLTGVTVVSGPQAGTGEIPLLGGSTLRATGSSFSATDTVRLDGATVTTFARTSTTFDFVAPPHAAGPVGLVVTDVSGLTASLSDVVNYVGYVETTSSDTPGGNSVDDLSALRGVVGDLDGDGRSDDVVIANPSYLYGNFYVGPTGTRNAAGYGTAYSPGTRAEYTRLLFGDANGHLVDVTSANMPSAGSDPSGLDDWNASAVALGDLDGQNGPEIILGGVHADYVNYNDVRVLVNDGSGGFTHSSSLSPASTYLPPYYVYAAYNGNVYPYYTYLVYTARYVLGVPTSIAVGDLDRDNDLDVVVAREYHDRTYVSLNPLYIGSTNGYATIDYAILYNYNYGTPYANPVYLSTYYYYSALEVFDNDASNGNGLRDVTTSRLPSVGSSASSIVPAFHGRDVAIGDLDGQNGPDIVVTWDDPTTVSAYGMSYGAGYDAPRVATRVLTNNGSGGFADVTTTWLPAGLSPEFFQANQVELADLDGDGDLDMVLLLDSGIDAFLTSTPTHTRSVLRVLRNNHPTAGFTDVTASAIPALTPGTNDDFRGDALLVRDLDGDGFPDIVAATRETLSGTGGVRIRSTRLFLGGTGLVFRRGDEFLPAASGDSGQADTVLSGDLAGSARPTLLQLGLLRPSNPGNGERLRTHRWTR